VFLLLVSNSVASRRQSLEDSLSEEASLSDTHLRRSHKSSRTKHNETSSNPPRDVSVRPPKSSKHTGPLPPPKEPSFVIPIDDDDAKYRSSKNSRQLPVEEVAAVSPTQGVVDPKPTFRNTPQNVTVSPGDRAVLKCRVDHLGTKTVRAPKK